MNRANINPLPINKYAITTVDIEAYFQKTIPGLNETSFDLRPVRYGQIIPLQLAIIATPSAIQEKDAKDVSAMSFVESITEKYSARVDIRLKDSIYQKLGLYRYTKELFFLEKKARKTKTMNDYEAAKFARAIDESFDIKPYRGVAAFVMLLNPFTIFVDMLCDGVKDEYTSRQVLITDCKVCNENRSAVYIVEETTDKSFSLRNLTGIGNNSAIDIENTTLKKILKRPS